MKVKDYIYINSLDKTGSTYEIDLINHFKIGTDQPIDKVREQLNKILLSTDKQVGGLNRVFKFKGKRWKAEDPILDKTLDQWIRLEQLVIEGDNIKNLNKLLAIYLRPLKFNWFKLRWELEKYDLNKQEGIYTDLLDLDILTAQDVMVFFYHSAARYMKYINIYYLNQMKKLENLSIPNR